MAVTPFTHTALEADACIISTLPNPSLLSEEIERMPYQLVVKISGFQRFPEAWIARLEQHLQIFFFQPPARLDGTLSLYCDLIGDAGNQVRRCQLFFLALRQVFSPSLTFTLEFEYQE